MSRSATGAFAPMQEYLPSGPRAPYSFHPRPPMGILDDAIRQHLDLKRQRGATESELRSSRTRRSARRAGLGSPTSPRARTRAIKTATARCATAAEPEAPTRRWSPWSRAPRRAVRERAPGRGVTAGGPTRPPALEDESQAAEPTPASGGADDGLRPDARIASRAVEPRSRRGRRARARGRSADRVAGHGRALAPRRGGRARGARSPRSPAAEEPSSAGRGPAIEEQRRASERRGSAPRAGGGRGGRGRGGRRRPRGHARSSSRTPPRTTSSGSSRASRRTSTSSRLAARQT